MTFEEFQKSGRDVIDLGAEIPGMDLEGQSGRIYAHQGGPFIELVVDGSWMLVLANESWIEPPERLADLERRLFDWAVGEEVI